MSDEFIPQVITGEMVVREARAYLGVRFKHTGESFEGIDCSGLALAVARTLGQAPLDYRRPAYSLRPDPALFMREILRWTRRIERDERQAGDIALMTHHVEQPRTEHCAFVTDIGLLHIFPAASIARVTEHSLDALWERKILHVLRLKGVVDAWA